METSSLSLTPATRDEFAYEVRLMIKFGRTFNIEISSVEASISYYAESLSDLPRDLLHSAFTQVRSTWKWGNRLPMPGDIQAFVRDDLHRRTLTSLRLKTAKLKMDREEENARRRRSEIKVSPETTARVNDILAGISRSKKRDISGDDPSPAEIEKRRQEWLRFADENQDP